MQNDEYKIDKELLTEMIKLLQEMPYRASFQVLNALGKVIGDQDASKKASLGPKKANL